MEADVLGLDEGEAETEELGDELADVEGDELGDAETLLDGELEGLGELDGLALTDEEGDADIDAEGLVLGEVEGEPAQVEGKSASKDGLLTAVSVLLLPELSVYTLSSVHSAPKFVVEPRTLH